MGQDNTRVEFSVAVKEQSCQDKNSTDFKEYLPERVFPLLHGSYYYLQMFVMSIVNKYRAVENELLTATLESNAPLYTSRNEAEVKEIYQDHDELDS